MPRSRGSAVVAAVVVLVVALVVGSTLAFTKDDGASTPQEAVTAMAAALGQGDLSAVFLQLPPGERRALQDGTLDLATQLERIGLISTLDPANVDGVRAQFSDLRMMDTEISKDTMAIDLVGGTLTIPSPLDGSSLLTDRGRAVLERLGVDVAASGSTFVRDFDADPMRIMVIREGGGWHVSIAYTVAEAIRIANEHALPEMGKGPAPIGGATPGAAVEDLVRAYADGDPSKVVAMLSSEEARSVYDYAPVFLPGARERSAQAAADKTYDVQLNRIETEVTGSGQTRRVRVKAFDLDIRDEVHKTHVTFDGRCLHTDVRIRDDDEPYAKSDTCDGEWTPADVEARVRDNPLANLAIFGGGAQLPTFTVVERGGRWFVSPVQSLLSSTAETLATIPPEAVGTFADRLAASWRAGDGGGISGDPFRGVVDDPEASEDVRRLVKQRALIGACRRLASGDQARAVAKSCIARLVETGRVDAVEVPGDL